MAALLQPHLCFKFPPKAFWWFVIHLCVVAFMGSLQDPLYYSLIIEQLVTQTQLLILFWVSYNLMLYEQIGKGTIWALALSCLTLAVLQVGGITSEAGVGGRATAFDANPNTIGVVLSVGLLALVGLAYGRQNVDLKVRRLAWLGFGVLATAIIRTGSRGAVVALVAGLVALIFQGRSLATKLKVGLIVLVGIGALVWTAYQVESIRMRWERAFFAGDVSGRDRIFEAGWKLFEEKPLVGWGPVRIWYELGHRLGLPIRDPHNLYLWILLETGLLGAILFFRGLWLCVHAAWKARHRIHGVLPLAMIFCFLVGNLKGTGHKDKLLWVVLAYALASGSYASLPWQWHRRTLPTAAGPRASQPLLY